MNVKLSLMKPNGHFNANLYLTWLNLTNYVTIEHINKVSMYN